MKKILFILFCLPMIWFVQFSRSQWYSRWDSTYLTFKLSKNYMKRILFYLFIFFSINVFSQTTDWVKSFGGVNSDKGISIGADSLGFIYVSGFYNSEATFGSITLSNGSPGTNKE